MLGRIWIGGRVQRQVAEAQPRQIICCYVMPRSHIHGLNAGLATDTIRHHSWQSVLVRSFPYCIRNHT